MRASRPIHGLLLRRGLHYPATAGRVLPRLAPAPGIASPGPALSRLPRGAATFHSSASRLDDNRSAPPQSPWRVFVDTLTAELKKNRELAEDVKQLQGDVDKLADAKAIKAAKDLYMRTRVIADIKENPKLRAAAEALQKQGLKVSDAVGEAMQAVEDSEFMKGLARASAAVSSAAATATAPVRNTAAYKALSDSVVEAFEEGSRYGGYEGKEERRRRRELRAERAGRRGVIKRERVKENPDAGEALVLSDKQETPSWTSGLRNSAAFMRLRDAMEESENPVVSAFRTATYKIGSLFEENETARVIRSIKTLDPGFNMDSFQKELREYIIPEVVDAYLNADGEALKMWCGEATYNVLWATMQQYTKQGLVSDSKVLDIRHVDISAGKMLENDVPVFLVTFATQEILMFRSAKTGEVMVGAPDGVEQVRYAAVLTLVEDELENPETNGWKIVEMARRGARGYL